MIAVTEKGNILDHYNIDTLKITHNKQYLQEKLKEFKSLNAPSSENPLDSTQYNWSITENLPC
jgi:negative regulator of sigma E activity